MDSMSDAEFDAKVGFPVGERYVPKSKLDASERERDALREALNEAARFIEVVASADFDEIAADGGVDVGMVIQKQAATVNAPRARAALTANHSAPVVEE